MESKKITTNNPLVNPNKMRQKLVTAADYNALHDDVQTVTDTVNNLPTPTASAFPIKDYGIPGDLFVWAQSVNVQQDAGPTATVTAEQVIRAIHFTGNPASLRYQVTKTGEVPQNPENADPTLVSWTDTDVPGVVLLTLSVNDGAILKSVTTYMETQAP
jgi:hypothetical protein